MNPTPIISLVTNTSTSSIETDTNTLATNLSCTAEIRNRETSLAEGIAVFIATVTIFFNAVIIAAIARGKLLYLKFNLTVDFIEILTLFM